MKINSNIILFLLIIVIILLIIILLGMVIYLFHVYKKNKESKQLQVYPSKTLNEYELIKDKLHKEQMEHLNQSGYCFKHVDFESVGTCNICERPCCKKCLKTVENLSFCPEHFQLYLNNDWQEIALILSTSETPLAAIKLYEFKEKKWREDNTPLVIITHYKINFDNDLIESHVKLLAIKENADHLQKEYQN